MNRFITARVPPGAKRCSDAALVDGFVSRNADDCFEGLVNRYKDKVFRLAVSIMGPDFSYEAEDITQEVFLQVFRKLSTFRKDSSFSTWLYRIAYNMALARKQKARFRIPHQGEKMLDDVAAPDDPSVEVNRDVLDGIESLDEPYRTVIYQHYWMKSPVSEIAECLGTRPGTVKSYLCRGRKRLAQILKKEQDDG